MRDDASHSTARTAANLMRQVYRNITKAIPFGNFRFVLGTCLFCCSLKATPRPSKIRGYNGCNVPKGDLPCHLCGKRFPRWSPSTRRWSRGSQAAALTGSSHSTGHEAPNDIVRFCPLESVVTGIVSLNSHCCYFLMVVFGDISITQRRTC